MQGSDRNQSSERTALTRDFDVLSSFESVLVRGLCQRGRVARRRCQHSIDGTNKIDDAGPEEIDEEKQSVVVTKPALAGRPL